MAKQNPHPSPADAGGMPRTAYVYMVRCADHTLYTGWTDDLSRRVRAHNEKKGAKYTKSRTPVRLVYAEALSEKGEALRREAAIKKLTRTQKEALIAAFAADMPGWITDETGKSAGPLQTTAAKNAVPAATSDSKC